MHLTKLRVKNLKNGNFDLDLTRANALIGDNFVGKTRITDAVRLLLIGHLPELGKTAKSTFGLASGSPMEVSGTFSDGRTITRRWFAKGNTIKEEVDAPNWPEGTEPLLTVMLNADEYFALTDRARVNYVFANCPMENMLTREDIAIRVDKVAPKYEFRRFFPDLDATNPPLANRQEEIDAIIEFVTAEWKGLNASVKQMDETIKGLTRLRSEDDKARPLATAEDQKLAINLKLTEARDRKAALMNEYTAQHTAQLRRTAIVRDLQQVDRDRADKLVLDEKVARLTRELASAPVPAMSIIDASTACTEAQGHVNLICRRIEEIATATRTRQQEKADVQSQQKCPYCGAVGEGWKAQRLAELDEILGVLEGNQSKAMSIHKERNADWQAAIDKRDAVKTAFALIDRLQSEKASTERSLAAIAPRLERAKAIEEERDRLPTLDPELTTKVDMLTSEIRIHEQAIRDLDTEIKSAVGRQHDLKRLADAETLRDKTKEQLESAKLAGTELRVIQGELVEAAFGPLLKTANRIFGKILKSTLQYRDGEIGTWREGWIGHMTMSGTEKLLTYAAIQAALAAKSPVKIMLLDEMGRLTRDNASKVAACVLFAIADGLIDQAICIDPERPDLYESGSIEDLAFTIIPVK